jgi:hypothetical protein
MTKSITAGRQHQEHSVFSSDGRLLPALICTLISTATQTDESAFDETISTMNSVMRDKPASVKRQLRIFLRAVQWLPTLRYGRTFTSLGFAQRVMFLRYLENHRIQLVRVGFGGLRSLVLFAFYGREEAKRAIGYGVNSQGWEAHAA